VVSLLRAGHATVEELAQALGLTDNAVRAHLAALERDGLVAHTGLRRGVGKPAYTYALTPNAEYLYPKAYGTLLRLMLDALEERLPPEALADLLRDVGQRLAMGQTLPHGDLRARVAGAVAMLDAMGGLATAEEENGGFVIQGCSCPLAAAVEGHPETCLLAEALLADVIGAPVRQVCDPAGAHCRFEIGAPAVAGERQREPLPGA
jgi:predicted ArsR family transcriptional regulator